VIQVPLNPAVLTALAGMQATQGRFDREAERIAEPADTEPGAQDGEDGVGGGADPETLLQALVVEPALYRANAQTLRSADEQTGRLLDIYA
jgi:hypothetical protein